MRHCVVMPKMVSVPTSQKIYHKIQVHFSHDVFKTGRLDSESVHEAMRNITYDFV